MILMAVACLVFVSCGNKKQNAEPVAEEQCCALTEAQQEMFANWENWADLDADTQVALVADMKAFIDDCKAKCAEKCAEKEAAEPKDECPAKKAKCEEMKAKWDAFETFSLDEQKAIIDEVLACHAKKCCKDKEETCKHEE